MRQNIEIAEGILKSYNAIQLRLEVAVQPEHPWQPGYGDGGLCFGAICCASVWMRKKRKMYGSAVRMRYFHTGGVPCMYKMPHATATIMQTINSCISCTQYQSADAVGGPGCEIGQAEEVSHGEKHDPP